MSQVRIHGDPFGEDAAASRLRSFVRLAVGSGVECALSLSAVRPRAVAPGETPIPLHDGVRDLQIGTRLPPAEIELLLRSASNAVAATAPVVAFAPPAGLADAVRVAGLEWPEASAVLPATTAQSTIELLGRVRAELRWAGAEDPPHALPAVELAPWLALPSLRPGSAANGWLVHFGSTDPAHGTDLVLELWREWSGAAVRGLRIVVAPGENLGSADFAATMRSSGRVEIVRAVPAPEHLADAAAVLLPWRRPCDVVTPM